MAFTSSMSAVLLLLRAVRLASSPSSSTLWLFLLLHHTTPRRWLLRFGNDINDTDTDTDTDGEIGCTTNPATLVVTRTVGSTSSNSSIDRVADTVTPHHRKGEILLLGLVIVFSFFDFILLVIVRLQFLSGRIISRGFPRPQKIAKKNQKKKMTIT